MGAVLTISFCPDWLKVTVQVPDVAPLMTVRTSIMSLKVWSSIGEFSVMDIVPCGIEGFSGVDSSGVILPPSVVEDAVELVDSDGFGVSEEPSRVINSTTPIARTITAISADKTIVRVFVIVKNFLDHDKYISVEKLMLAPLLLNQEKLRIFFRCPASIAFFVQ